MGLSPTVRVRSCFRSRRHPSIHIDLSAQAALKQIPDLSLHPYILQDVLLNSTDVFLTKHNAIITTRKINRSSLERSIMNLLHNASFSVTCLVVARVHTCPPPGTKASSPHKGSQPGPPTRGCPPSEEENSNTKGADGRGPGPSSSRPEPARSARAARAARRARLC